MEGYKTWTGIIIAVAGAVGLGNVFGNDNVAGIVNTLAQLIGFVLAAYGNYKAHKKIDTLAAKAEDCE